MDKPEARHQTHTLDPSGVAFCRTLRELESCPERPKPYRAFLGVSVGVDSQAADARPAPALTMGRLFGSITAHHLNR